MFFLLKIDVEVFVIGYCNKTKFGVILHWTNELLMSSKIYRTLHNFRDYLSVNLFYNLLWTKGEILQYLVVWFSIKPLPVSKIAKSPKDKH